MISNLIATMKVLGVFSGMFSWVKGLEGRLQSMEVFLAPARINLREFEIVII